MPLAKVWHALLQVTATCRCRGCNCLCLSLLEGPVVQGCPRQRPAGTMKHHTSAGALNTSTGSVHDQASNQHKVSMWYCVCAVNSSHMQCISLILICHADGTHMKKRKKQQT